jgi:GntR family transcriptional regulator/MocR family aminotransferase
VLFEDPGYFLAAQSLLAAGTKLVPVPVDDDGMRIEEAAAQNVPARLAVVTPSHQSPLGVALSLHRRLALLAWATGSGGWILEDDYDGEFHYRGRPLPALKSLDRDDVVIYAGTFSKVLFPALRLGYLVVPQRLLGLFQNAAASFGGVGRLEQAVVRRFIDEGYFARHLKRMRDLYAGRRAALAAALQSVFGNSMAIGLQSGGMHLLARPGGSHSDTELARLAEAQGLEISPLSMHALAAECAPGLLLSFTNIPAEQAMAAAERLYAAIGRALARP